MDVRTVLYLGIIILTGVIIVNPIFNEGFLVCQDNPPHLAESYFLIKELIPNGKLFGWADIESAGFPIFVNFYPLGFWLVAIINVIPWLTVVNSYKMVVLISYLAPSIGVFFLLRKLFTKEIAVIISVLLLFQFDFISFPLNGLWSQYLSILFAVAYIILFNKIIDGGRYNLINFSVLGILIALTLLSHVFSLVFIAYYSLIALVLYKIKSKINLTKIVPYLVLSGIIGLILSFAYLIPTLQTSALIESGEDITSSDFSTLIFKTAGYTFLPHLRIDDLKTQIGWEYGRIDFGNFASNLTNFIGFSFLNIAEIVFSIIALIGILVYLKHDRKNLFLTIMFISLLISVILGSGLVNLLPLEEFPILINLIQVPRYLLYARIIMAVFVAYGLIWIFKSVDRKSISKVMSSGLLILILILAYLVFHLSLNQLTESSYLCMKTSANADGMQEVNGTWSWVSENVNPLESRVVYQSTFGNSAIDDLKDSHILAMSAHETNVDSVGTWQGAVTTMLPTVSTNYVRLFNSSVEKISDGEIGEWLELFNAKYIVPSESKLKSKLETSNLFANEKDFGNFSIFSLKDYKPTWIRVNGIDVDADIIEFQNENKIFKIKTTSTSDILIKVVYHPYWIASINDKDVVVERDDRGFIKLETNEIGDLTIVLSYRSPIPI